MPNNDDAREALDENAIMRLIVLVAAGRRTPREVAHTLRTALDQQDAAYARLREDSTDAVMLAQAVQWMNGPHVASWAEEHAMYLRQNEIAERILARADLSQDDTTEGGE